VVCDEISPRDPPPPNTQSKYTFLLQAKFSPSLLLLWSGRGCQPVVSRTNPIKIHHNFQIHHNFPRPPLKVVLTSLCVPQLLVELVHCGVEVVLVITHHVALDVMA